MAVRLLDSNHWNIETVILKYFSRNNNIIIWEERIRLNIFCRKFTMFDLLFCTYYSFICNATFLFFYVNNGVEWYFFCIKIFLSSAVKTLQRLFSYLLSPWSIAGITGHNESRMIEFLTSYQLCINTSLHFLLHYQ